MKIFDNINKSHLFFYVIIFIIILYFFSRLDITLNILFGTIIAGIIIYYLYYNDTQNTIKKDYIIKEKKNIIIPKSDVVNTSQSDENIELINFLFTIQDFYTFNPQSYSSLIQNIDYFYQLKDDAENNNFNAGLDCNSMKEIKRNALNSLMEITYKLKPNLEYDNKLKNAVEELNNILNNEIYKIYLLYKKYNYDNNNTTRTQLVDTNDILPYNTYNDTLFTTQLI